MRKKEEEWWSNNIYTYRYRAEPRINDLLVQETKKHPKVI